MSDDLLPMIFFLSKVALDCSKVSQEIRKKTRKFFYDLFFKQCGSGFEGKYWQIDGFGENIGTDRQIHPSHLVRSLDGKLQYQSLARSLPGCFPFRLELRPSCTCHCVKNYSRYQSKQSWKTTLSDWSRGDQRCLPRRSRGKHLLCSKTKKSKFWQTLQHQTTLNCTATERGSVRNPRKIGRGCAARFPNPLLYLWPKCFLLYLWNEQKFETLFVNKPLNQS